MKLLSSWRLALFVVISILSGFPSWAARPMVTDDANVVDPRACQVESWVRSIHSSVERWAVPGCNFFGDTELSVGANYLSVTDEPNQQLGLLQVKKRWRVVESGQWGLSTTVGRVQSPSSVSRGSPNVDTYLNVPVTWATLQGPILHLNLGAFHHQAERVTQTTWGVGAEVPVHPRLFAIMETYGETGTRSKVQVGLRFWLVPQVLQVDTTLGQDIQGVSNTRWLSMGLRFLTPALY